MKFLKIKEISIIYMKGIKYKLEKFVECILYILMSLPLTLYLLMDEFAKQL